MSQEKKITRRYSDEELNEFRLIIEEKLEKAKENLAMLLEAFSNDANDLGDTSPTFKILEEGSSVQSKEYNASMAARQQKFIKDLEAALVRIQNKTYGICRISGELIPKERLRLVPHATLTVEAKNLEAQRKKLKNLSAFSGKNKDKVSKENKKN
jgi:RNA polymerase-binding transcription factor DksA